MAGAHDAARDFAPEDARASAGSLVSFQHHHRDRALGIALIIDERWIEGGHVLPQSCAFLTLRSVRPRAEYLGVAETH